MQIPANSPARANSRFQFDKRNQARAGRQIALLNQRTLHGGSGKVAASRVRLRSASQPARLHRWDHMRSALGRLPARGGGILVAPAQLSLPRCGLAGIRCAGRRENVSARCAQWDESEASSANGFWLRFSQVAARLCRQPVARARVPRRSTASEEPQRFPATRWLPDLPDSEHPQSPTHSGASETGRVSPDAARVSTTAPVSLTQLRPAALSAGCGCPARRRSHSPASPDQPRESRRWSSARLPASRGLLRLRCSRRWLVSAARLGLRKPRYASSLSGAPAPDTPVFAPNAAHGSHATIVCQ